MLWSHNDRSCTAHFFAFDYSFVRVHRGKNNAAPTGPVVLTKARVNGAIFGAGLACRF